MSDTGRLDWRTLALVVVVAVAVVIGMLALSDEGPAEPSADPSTPTEPTMSRLVFAVWGTEGEIAAYQSVVDEYNKMSKDVDVRIQSWPDPESMMADVNDGKVTPDLYLLRRSDLAETVAEGRNQPLQDLIDARGLNLSDDYSRDSVTAFSAEDDLQCMPYGTSPMVMYYNTDLIDFETMAERGLPTPDPEHESFSLAEFRAAAEFASRPRKKTRGVHIEPTLRGLAPFIYSGGGRLFDDEVEPTSLEIGGDDATDALRDTLEVLRDPKITLSDQQLEQQSALEWFQDGKVGMIAGYRGLTPTLRATEGLKFDVLPMPSLGSPSTLGDLTGMCIADGPTDRVQKSADFLVHLVSDSAVATVTETGHLVPTNLEVSFQPAFVQPDRDPQHALVFTGSVRDIVPQPLAIDWAALEDLVGPDLEALLTEPVLDDLDAMLDAIDEESRSILDPDYVPESDDPSPPPSGSPSGASDAPSGVPSGESPDGSSDAG